MQLYMIVRGILSGTSGGIWIKIYERIKITHPPSDPSSRSWPIIPERNFSRLPPAKPPQLLWYRDWQCPRNNLNAVNPEREQRLHLRDKHLLKKSLNRPVQIHHIVPTSGTQHVNLRVSLHDPTHWHGNDGDTYIQRIGAAYQVVVARALLSVCLLSSGDDRQLWQCD